MKQTIVTVLALFAAGWCYAISPTAVAPTPPPLSVQVCPVGTILPWVGADADLPSNWVLCKSGAKLPGNATYKGAIPDLNNQFLRGTTNPKSVLKSGGSDSHNFKRSHEIPSMHTWHDTSTYETGFKTSLKQKCFDGEKVVYGVNQKGHGDIVRLKTKETKTAEKTDTIPTVPKYVHVRFIIRVR